jgi:hypothetical protein
MKYLVDLNFTEDQVDLINKNIPANAVETMEKSKELVISNINYLIELGVNNYQDAFIKFYNMFLLNNNDFVEIFSKYDTEDLIVKLEKNVAIMEYL